MNYRFDLPGYPRYIIVGKRKFYLTAQLFYSGINWHLRKKIVQEAKKWLKTKMAKLPQMDRCKIDIKFSGKITDLDNKSFFWCKILQDYLVNCKIIRDDRVEFIPELHFFYEKSKIDKMTITIEEI